jgi:hypothetical protein
MFYRKLTSFATAVLLAVAAVVATSAADSTDQRRDNQRQVKAGEYLNLAILIQDDLDSQVSNELGVTREFIRSLPSGSRVMVGYITTGTLQVRQPFTADLDKAARSLRRPFSSDAASPYNPYVEVIEALRAFDGLKGQNAVLLISDGLDTSRGFDVSSSANSIDLVRAIEHANKQNVMVFTFYAPSVGLTSRSRIAASYGQNSLTRLAHDTGGKAFFQGSTGFVTFDSYFKRLRETLNEREIISS